MPTDVQQRLALHIKTQKVHSTEGWLFLNSRGTHLTYSNWRKRTWLPVVARAQVGGVNPHDLRHTYATLRIAKGDNIVDVSKQLGHKNISITLDTYTHWVPME